MQFHATSLEEKGETENECCTYGDHADGAKEISILGFVVPSFSFEKKPLKVCIRQWQGCLILLHALSKEQRRNASFKVVDVV